MKLVERSGPIDLLCANIKSIDILKMKFIFFSNKAFLIHFQNIKKKNQISFYIYLTDHDHHIQKKSFLFRLCMHRFEYIPSTCRNI